MPNGKKKVTQTTSKKIFKFTKKLVYINKSRENRHTHNIDKKTYLNLFKKQFLDFLSNITLKNKEIRDININLPKKDKKQPVKNYYDEICSFGFTIVINVLTLVNNLGETLVDQFYYSNLQEILNSIVILTNITAHFPLYVKLKFCNHSKISISCNVQFY